MQILSASLNPADYKFAEIPLLSALAIAKPAVPAVDFAGRVVDVGPGSSSSSSGENHPSGEEELGAGQLVFGRLVPPVRFGVLAQYAVVPRGGCVPLPLGVGVDDAACVGTAGLTAYQCIIPNVKTGDGVFINGGSGGVGSFGIQIAKAKGCYVVASCSGANVQLCRSLGADHVVDYTSQDLVAELEKMARKFDLVVDNVGAPGELYWRAHHFTKPGARFVQVGAGVSAGAMFGLVSRMVWPGFLGGGKRPFRFLGVKNNPDQFRDIAGWMAEGKVKAVIDEVFGMDDQGPVRAFEKLKTGRVKGKLVVRVADP